MLLGDFSDVDDIVSRFACDVVQLVKCERSFIMLE
jgi:hypothetical protein